MDILKSLRIFLYTTTAFYISGCFYYYPDLKAQSPGSLLGGFAAGIAVAEITSDIAIWGAGTIVGSVFGGMIGQEIDNTSPLRLDNPPNDPIPLFYYQTLRPPIVTERFEPAEIFLEKNGKQELLKPIVIT